MTRKQFQMIATARKAEYETFRYHDEHDAERRREERERAMARRQREIAKMTAWELR